MSKIVTLSWTALLAGIILFVCADKGTNNGDDDPALYPWDFLPSDSSVGTWVKSDTSSYKIWHDADHPGTYLNDFINGGDLAYLPFGFVRGTEMVYRNGAGDDATMYIYEFPNADSASGLYTSLGLGTVTSPITGLGDAARINEQGLATNFIDAVSGRYYLSLDFPKTTQAEAESLASLAISAINTPR